MGFTVGLATMPAEAEVLMRGMDGLAWLVLELMNVLLIDFPMCFLAGLTLALLYRDSEPRDGMICGALFLVVIVILIFTLEQILSIAEPVKMTLNELRAIFGARLLLIGLSFLIFDLGMCMLGGILGVTVGSAMRVHGHDKQVL